MKDIDYKFHTIIDNGKTTKVIYSIYEGHYEEQYCDVLEKNKQVYVRDNTLVSRAEYEFQGKPARAAMEAHFNNQLKEYSTHKPIKEQE